MPNIEFFLVIFLLGIILYFPISYLGKRYNLNILSTKLSRYISSFILALFTYFGLALIFFFYVSYYSEKEFNKDEWFASPEKRYEMSEDLIDSNILIGKTKKEVFDLLGPTDSIGNNLIYDIGFLPGLFNIDPDIIEIEFQNNKVIKVKQRGT